MQIYEKIPTFAATRIGASLSPFPSGKSGSRIHLDIARHAEINQIATIHKTSNFMQLYKGRLWAPHRQTAPANRICCNDECSRLPVSLCCYQKEG